MGLEPAASLCMCLVHCSLIMRMLKSESRGMKGAGGPVQLWPGAVNFPDFISQEGQQWWANQLTVSLSPVEMEQCFCWIGVSNALHKKRAHGCKVFFGARDAWVYSVDDFRAF